jgi:hypothetical protein
MEFSRRSTPQCHTSRPDSFTDNIASDPNRLDEEQYIVRLIGQVITESLETMQMVKPLPALAKE